MRRTPAARQGWSRHRLRFDKMDEGVVQPRHLRRPWVRRGSANTAATSSAFLSAISGLVLYLITVRRMGFSSLVEGSALRFKDVWNQPKDATAFAAIPAVHDTRSLSIVGKGADRARE
jgi:hypothetical protein